MKSILLVLVLISWCNCIHAAAIDNQIPNGAECFHDEYQCESNDQCVLELRRCDGIPDCRDQSDETNCTSVKLPGVGPTSADSYRKLGLGTWPVFIFNMSNSSIVSSPISIFPQETTKECTKYEYKCNGKCFPFAIICNGSKECNDGSDEKDCPSSTQESSTNPSTTPTKYATTTEPSPTTKKPKLSKSWKITSNDGSLPSEKQQFAIDCLILAFAKYNHNDYLSIAIYTQKAFEEKYKSPRWICTISTIGASDFRSYFHYTSPHWMIIDSDDGGIRAEIWESA